MNDRLSFYVQRYFTVYLIKQHNYGGNTITSYRDTFRLLLRFLEEKGRNISDLRITAVDKDLVSDFLQWLEKERHNSMASRNVRLAHLKSFFRYLMMNAPEYSDQCSKVLSIPFGKVGKRPPECLSTEAVRKLLSASDSSTHEGLRHLAIMTLLYDSGCRVQELIALNVSDFQPGRCSRIYVHGKGNKYRSIPLLKETEKIISKYITSFHLAGESPLFSNVKGERLTRQGIRYIIRKYSGLANEEQPEIINAGIHPHLLRHSKATHLVNGGVNIYNVRDFLGHESVATTQVYLTTSPEVTRKAIENVISQTVPESRDYYSPEEKNDLLAFLETLK